MVPSRRTTTTSPSCAAGRTHAVTRLGFRLVGRVSAAPRGAKGDSSRVLHQEAAQMLPRVFPQANFRFACRSMSWTAFRSCRSMSSADQHGRKEAPRRGNCLQEDEWERLSCFLMHNTKCPRLEPPLDHAAPPKLGPRASHRELLPMLIPPFSQPAIGACSFACFSAEMAGFSMRRLWLTWSPRTRQKRVTRWSAARWNSALLGFRQGKRFEFSPEKLGNIFPGH